MNLRCLAIFLAFGLASQAQANVTYGLVNYPDEQNGATVSGSLTLRPGPNSTAISIDDVLDWTVTISEGTDSFTAKKGDTGALLTIVGLVNRTTTELTIAPNAGWLWFESDTLDLQYDRIDGIYSGSGENTIAWQSNTVGTEPWVIARTLAVAVPEPSSPIMLSLGLAGLGFRRIKRLLSSANSLVQD